MAAPKRKVNVTAAKPSAAKTDTAARAAAGAQPLPGAEAALGHGAHAMHASQANDEHFDGEVHAHWPTQWTEPQKLDAPSCRPGFVQRWVRADLKGEADPNNVASQFRQGWRPRDFLSVPEGERVRFPSIDIQGFGSVMKNGDLILCEMPVGIFEQMKAFYARRAQKQLSAISPEAVVAKHNSEVDLDRGFGEITVTRSSRVGGGRVPMVARDD